MDLQENTYYEVSVFALQQYVKELYDTDIEFVATEEWRNDTQHTFWGIDGEIDSYFDANLYKAMAGETELYICRPALNMLVRDGWLPSGDYLITVSW
jgi:hypothetical protein